MKRSANKPNRFNNNGMSYLAELNQGNYPSPVTLYVFYSI